MWDQGNNAILLICGLFIVCSVTAARPNVGRESTDFSFPEYFTFNEPLNRRAPAVVAQIMGKSHMENREKIPTLNVILTEIREDFNLTLLVIPQNSSKCPPTINETFDLRQYERTHEFLRNGDTTQMVTFPYIFSGCYYVLMTNARRISWQSRPEFHETVYRFRNKKIEVDEPTFSPENTNERMKMEISLTISMDCIRVQAEIWELNKTINDTDVTREEVRKAKRDSLQRCFFFVNRLVQCDGTTHVQFRLWQRMGQKVTVTWENLQRGGGVYYLYFYGDSGECPDLEYWRPVVQHIYKLHGLERIHEEEPHKSLLSTIYPTAMISLPVMLGISIAAILAFFILKYWRDAKPLNEKEKLKQLIKTDLKIDITDLKQILLIYAKGSPEFMEAMSSLRYDLKQQCDCEVHDVYSPDEFAMVGELSPHGWVRKLLIEGSKVVWIDTPQLRSLFNGKQKQDVQTDCRDEVIPYAIELVTNIFPDPTTQYLDHFVVLVKGFEVEDGHDQDPLRVVSPHTRYCIPGHFTRLCGDLIRALKSPEDTGNEVRL